MFFLLRLLFHLFEDAQHRQIQHERERESKLPNWRPRTREEADQADEDEDLLEEAEAYERAGKLKKALAIYRELARCSLVPTIIVKAKSGFRRVKRAQGL